MMMTINEIRTATLEQLADELAAACECTEDWRTANIDDLRDRVRSLVQAYSTILIEYADGSDDGQQMERLLVWDSEADAANDPGARAVAQLTRAAE